MSSSAVKSTAGWTTRPSARRCVQGCGSRSRRTRRECEEHREEGGLRLPVVHPGGLMGFGRVLFPNSAVPFFSLDGDKGQRHHLLSAILISPIMHYHLSGRNSSQPSLVIIHHACMHVPMYSCILHLCLSHRHAIIHHTCIVVHSSVVSHHSSLFIIMRRHPSVAILTSVLLFARSLR